MPAVAFSAVPSVTRNYDDGDTLLFDTVYTNVGGAYNNVTGVFSCPSSGVYAFHVTVYSAVDASMNAAITHSRLGSLVNVYVSNVDATVTGNQSSNLVVIDCAAGDTVHVQAASDGDNLFVGFPFPSFSGYSVGVAST